MYLHSPLQLAKPRLLLYGAILAIVLSVTLPLYAQQTTAAGIALSWYLSVVWTLPILVTFLMLTGAVWARHDLQQTSRRDRNEPYCTYKLIVQIPTIGRHDVIPALTRVVASFEASLPAYFADWRVDVVSEEGAEAGDALLAMSSPNVRVVFVPAQYRTLNGTERKARANCYADELRAQNSEVGRDVWILHMDDDTSISHDTAAEIARVMNANPFHRRAKHLAQGVLTFPRQFAVSYWTWVADAVRPASDLTIFRFTTGAGYPMIGVHGELLLVRSSVEHEIGWDFGRLLSITEDANFALLFVKHFPGASMWFPARCYGASPATIQDLITQRTRWARGLLHVVSNGKLPVRARMLMGYAMSAWIIGPLQHVGLVLLVAIMLGAANTSPVVPSLVILWGCNMAVQMWAYAEGLTHNVHASGRRRPAMFHWATLLFLPVFSLIEGWAGVRGAIEFAKDKTGTQKGELFTVISKPS